MSAINIRTNICTNYIRKQEIIEHIILAFSIIIVLIVLSSLALAVDDTSECNWWCRVKGWFGDVVKDE
ncbi:hypothetical protein J4437_02870 [Candidatus Woesearchaeota archaeon]|nr:hypothetical protein [Candidatus Woesearchaeota archaeon]